MSSSLFEVAAGRKLLLHVGCGPRNPELVHPLFRTAEWVEMRLDIDPMVEPDIVASMLDMKGVPSASVDAVWSGNNLEHLYPHEVPGALREFLRVLKPEGFALIAVPDLRWIARAVADDRLTEPLYDTPAGKVTALDALFGFGPALKAGNLFMAHHTGFTPRSLDAALRQAGFDHIELYQGQWEFLARARATGHATRCTMTGNAGDTIK
jgi:SAM-dependent methyltransferase